MLLSILPLTRPLGAIVQNRGLSRLLDVADLGLARLRGRLGRFVPEGPAPRRYP